MMRFRNAIVRFGPIAVVALIVGFHLSADDEPVLRTPSMPEWSLVRKVDPEYPVAALQHRIQGIVRFEALIGKDGRIEGLRLLAGHPLLTRAARKAAQQWIYHPTLRGGKPFRVITEIDIQFRIDPYGRPLKDRDRNGSGPSIV